MRRNTIGCRCEELAILGVDDLEKARGAGGAGEAEAARELRLIKEDLLAIDGQARRYS